MGFVKVVKSKAYFKRFQVKFRRRREGKTDFRARKRLIIQDKYKYNTPKYRFVVRITNKDVICQIVYAKIAGDFVVTSAYSHELPSYGVSFGLTNYAAAYATGLLCARRCLQKLGLADKYEGHTEVTGEDYTVAPIDNGPKPFRAVLDVGLARTSTGAKVFAALKGACDGGIDIPHGVTRFPGYSKEEKKLNAEVLREHIFGQHVAEYMNLLKDSDPEKYQEAFSRYIKEGIEADEIEDLYAECHKKIREDPSPKHTEKNVPNKQKKYKQIPLTLEQRRAALAERKEAIARKLAGDDE